MNDLIFCGTKLGTYKTWRSISDAIDQYNDFIPSDVVSNEKTPRMAILDRELGIFEILIDEGETDKDDPVVQCFKFNLNITKGNLRIVSPDEEDGEVS